MFALKPKAVILSAQIYLKFYVMQSKYLLPLLTLKLAKANIYRWSIIHSKK
jgi:hypothetical protein